MASPDDKSAREPLDPAGDPPADPIDQEPVPRLPRGRGLALTGPAIFRILMFAALLVAVVVLRRPCAESTAGFVDSFAPPPDAGSGFVHIKPDMSEEEVRQQIERARGGEVDIPAGEVVPAPEAELAPAE